MIPDFQPGDVIITRKGSGFERRRVVQDPPRTRNGKLRTRVGTDGVQTHWWTPTTMPEVLQPYEIIRREDD